MSALVSIILPTYNSESFLMECLKSIQGQSFCDYEIINIDASSSDGTMEILKTFPGIRIIKQNGVGLASAWNQGILASNSKYISFLDSDDWWNPNCLQLHVDSLTNMPGLRYSIGKVNFFSDNPQQFTYGFKSSLLSNSHQALMPGCFMGERTLFNDLGFFDESLKVASDIQWFHDLKVSNIPHVRVEENLLNKRIHGNNLSYTTSKTNTYNDELLQVIHRRLRNLKSND
jgi:glycosyltransferase involved in cell wall biosynthesis